MGMSRPLQLSKGSVDVASDVQREPGVGNGPSLEMAPRKKKSQSESNATAAVAPADLSRKVRLAIKRFLSCSKVEYCNLHCNQFRN
jgi:hypothetical protein